MNRYRIAGWGAALFLLAGCAVGPNYQHPTTATAPAQWKEKGPWQPAMPQDEIAKGNWWEIFHDPTLDALEIEAQASNANLRAAVARVAEARATARVAEANFFPNITLDPSAQESHATSHALYPPGNTPPSYTGTQYHVPLDLSYEIDIWGRIRRTFEAANAEAQGSVADYQNVLLTLKADVAQDYFTLRSVDAERALLDGTVDLRRRALDLAQTRFKGGASSELDVAQAETELATVQAQAIDLGKQRAQLEHAIAVLIGKPPADFNLPAHPLEAEPPAIPEGLPSQLLERRPDVASAERAMAAANARIGVAQAAFFPAVRLSGDFGMESKDLTNLFAWSSRSWGFGPSFSLPIFDAGANSANLKFARATFEEAAANYKQKSLVAFADVEDGLSGLHVLSDETVAQRRAVDAARRAADISEAQYKSGLVNYLQIVDAERTLLDNQRQWTELQGQRFIATVTLIKALGGGWADATLIPKSDPKVDAKAEQIPMPTAAVPAS